MGVRELIRLHEEFECVGASGNLQEASEMVAQSGAELLICDLQYASGNALSFVSDMTQNRGVRCLVSSAHRPEVYGPLCRMAGASGYVHKSASPEFLIATLRAIVADQDGARFHGLADEKSGQSDVEIKRLHSLTAREWEVLNEIGLGSPTKVIAKKLHVSPKTIESHRASLKRKLDIASKDLLASYAAELRLGGT
jgi:DNA-binding NarL/FixJ family response regulator